MEVTWVDHGRSPQHPPNPDYPNGVSVDLSFGADEICTADLPYPAKRCGLYIVSCDRCGLTVAVTTAGRADDPKRVYLGCKTQERQ